MLKTDPPLINMVNQQPQVGRAAVYYLQDLWLSADDQVACYDGSHFLQLRVGHFDDCAQIILKLLSDLSMVGKLSDLFY